LEPEALTRTIQKDSNKFFEEKKGKDDMMMSRSEMGKGT
jgi:hypothetical protein